MAEKSTTYETESTHISLKNEIANLKVERESLKSQLAAHKKDPAPQVSPCDCKLPQTVHTNESDKQLISDLWAELLILQESNEKLKIHCSDAEQDLQNHLQRISVLEAEIASHEQITQHEQALRNDLEKRIRMLNESLNSANEHVAHLRQREDANNT